jgi:thiol:disulfide interchange protein DsbA
MRSLLLSLALMLVGLAPAHAQQPTLPGLTEGVEYRLLAEGQPYQPLPPGMVEVAEVFAYTCPHCAHFAPMLHTWAKRLPPHARLVLVPWVSDPNDPWARIYFAARKARAVDVLHPRLFTAIHDTGELPRTADGTQILAFASRIPGVDANALKAAWQDEAAQRDALRNAFMFERRGEVEGTPTLIVAGRYQILGNSYQNLLDNARKVVDALAPSRRASAATPPRPRP